MDKAQRNELLKARLRKLYPVTAKPVPASKGKRREWTPSRPFRDDGHGAGVYGNADNRHDWIWKKPKAKKVKLSHKRGAKKSALVKIAEQAPKKLRKRFVSAEHYLVAAASRKRR